MNRQEHLLDILIEECAEVIQRCTKAKRFGLDEIQPGQGLNNERRIIQELCDVLGTADLLLAPDPATYWVDSELVQEKKKRIVYFLKYSKECGTLEEISVPVNGFGETYHEIYSLPSQVLKEHLDKLSPEDAKEMLSNSFFAQHAHDVGTEIDRALEPKPIDMIIFCPNCHAQHIDVAQERCERLDVEEFRMNRSCSLPNRHSGYCVSKPRREVEAALWTNPPHKSHKCKTCNAIFRVADVPTNGVFRIKTKGEKDSYDYREQSEPISR